MTNRRRIVVALTAALVVLGLVGSVVVIRGLLWRPATVTAFFTTATSIYPGDDVRVSGVKVGAVDSVSGEGTQARVVFHIAHNIEVPADAKAVIVAQNLVSARYLQLTPAYRPSSTQLTNGAVIPVDRTAVPVEWDEVKTQLTRLAQDLGPNGTMSTTSVGNFIDSAANALQGNGQKLRQTLSQLAGVGRLLAEGGGNIVDIIKNLQTLVSTLRDSNIQIVQFQNRLATLTSVLDESRSDLDAALTNLSEAVGEVQQFIAGTRDKTSEQIQRLANVTQNLVDHRVDLENVLHVAPNAFANAYNMYNPNTGTVSGSFSFNNFANPLQFVCSAVGAIENVTAPETAKLCSDYFGPALRLLNLNYIPMPSNQYLRASAFPHNLIYTDPKLAPGGDGAPQPPETPPSVSAYTGAGDVSAPPGYGLPPAVAPGPLAPDRLPAAPSPALFPGAPVEGVQNVPPPPQDQRPDLQQLLLPGPPLPAEAPGPSPAGGTP